MRTSWAIVVAVMAAVPGREARAGEVWLRADASAVLPVTSPARDYFGLGAGVAGLGLTPAGLFFDLGGEAFYFFASRVPGSPLPGPASVLGFGPVVRVHSGRDTQGLFFWAQGGVDYIRTGGLDRVGLAAGAGLSYVFAPGTFAVGPRFDYRQVFALADAATFPTRDAGVLTFGLALEWGLFEPRAPTLRCPETPTANRPAGCPALAVVVATPLDTDGDHVPDPEDACPLAAGPAALKGCPDPDPDHDGVAGSADKCPLVPEDLDGFRDEDGCPDLDNDGDGLFDASDACPNENGPASMGGCPDQDGDGVADRLDKCPTVPGTAEERGCPRYARVRVTESKIEILQKIFFAFGTTTILPKSFPVLDEVVQAAMDRAQTCLRIEGHTDAVGNAQKNLALSQGRAEAVRTYLTMHGVPAPSLEAKGYGSALPLENNATSEGRERNRRVEFVLVPCAAPHKEATP